MMPSLNELLEREGARVDLEPGDFERLIRRRDRKRRNQRIAAGFVGIAVFVAAIWIVTSGLSLDRTHTPAVPGSKTGPTRTAPPPARASTAPDVVRQRMCTDGARWRLELTDIGDRIKVRFEVHRSPVGHEWSIHFRNLLVPCCSPTGPVIFRATRVASDSGFFVVQLRYPDRIQVDGVKAKALDTQTGQICRVWVLGPISN